MTEWPEWWDWELELSPHLLKRMLDRGFSETDLRRMMEDANGLRQDKRLERWIIESEHDSAPWEITVEPDPTDRVVVVITAYRVNRT